MRPFRHNKPLPARLLSFPHISSKGFTLVEMAIVLVIIGIAMALGLPLISQLSKNIKYSDSRDIVKGARDSVMGWAASGSLQQLPDLRNTTSDFRNIVKSPSDAFGQPLIYVYDYNSSTFTSNQLCGMRMTSINLSYKVGSVSYSVNNVAFVVLSPGDDYAVNSTITASNFIGANNVVSVLSANQAIPSPGGTANNATITINADTADDIVQWVTLDELRTKIGCQGTQLTIVNNELPYGYDNTPYSASIYGNGGVPYTASAGSTGQYKWCVQNTQGQVFYNLTFAAAPAQGGGAIAFSANCSGLSQSSWTQSDYIAISGTPNVLVTYSSNIFISLQANYNQTPPATCTNNAYWSCLNLTLSYTPMTWTSGNNLYFPSGSNTLTIYVADNGNNTASKNFTFTVNP